MELTTRSLAMGSVDMIEGFYVTNLKNVALRGGERRSVVTEDEFDKSVASSASKAIRLVLKLYLQDLNFSKQAEAVVREKSMTHFTELTGINIVRRSQTTV